MSEIPILPPDDVPRPREEVRIEQLEAHPWPDGRRVRICLRLTPFLERPNLLLVAHDEQDRIVAELNVIEPMQNDMEFTMHLRGAGPPGGFYTLSASLFYETRNPPADLRVETFFAPDTDEQDDTAAE